jgi:hypothetical protein
MRFPLLRRFGYVYYRNALASQSAMFYLHNGGIVNMYNCENSNHIRQGVMSRLSLPARSLRGRSASLRTVPDGAGGLLRKRLILLALLVMRPAISGVGAIFLPGLREKAFQQPKSVLTGLTLTPRPLKQRNFSQARLRRGTPPRAVGSSADRGSHPSAAAAGTICCRAARARGSARAG